MDEEVHGFASDNVDVLPNTRKDNNPYAYNGSGAGAFPPSFLHRGKKMRDIAEPKMDEEVHGFASDNVDVLPNTRKDNDPYAYNGSGAGAFPPQAFLHRGKGKKDIAEPKMDEEVHGFASDNVDVLPATRRDNEQYAYNGSGPGAFPASLYARQHKMKDIAEGGMEPNVHWFASDNVDVLPATRRDNEQYAYNGSGPKAFPPSYAQAGVAGINNKEVRPDVWVEVQKMINPATNWRVQEAPKSTYIPSPSATGPAKEPEAANPTPKEVDEKIKKSTAVPEETTEEREAKSKAAPVKKANPENEEGDLEPAKNFGEDEEKEELAVHMKEDPPAAAAAAAPAEEKEAAPAGPTEKVHEINPTDYQDLANNNAPGFRTTFYDKKNSLWRQASELVALNSQWM